MDNSDNDEELQFSESPIISPVMRKRLMGMRVGVRDKNSLQWKSFTVDFTHVDNPGYPSVLGLEANNQNAATAQQNGKAT